MNERVDVLIVGGGPGGLACAADLAAGGVRVLLAERKAKIGAKVCAEAGLPVAEALCVPVAA